MNCPICDSELDTSTYPYICKNCKTRFSNWELRCLQEIKDIIEKAENKEKAISAIYDVLQEVYRVGFEDGYEAALEESPKRPW